MYVDRPAHICVALVCCTLAALQFHSRSFPLKFLLRTSQILTAGGLIYVWLRHCFNIFMPFSLRLKVLCCVHRFRAFDRRCRQESGTTWGGFVKSQLFFPNYRRRTIARGLSKWNEIRTIARGLSNKFACSVLLHRRLDFDCFTTNYIRPQSGLSQIIIWQWHNVWVSANVDGIVFDMPESGVKSGDRHI